MASAAQEAVRAFQNISITTIIAGAVVLCMLLFESCVERDQQRAILQAAMRCDAELKASGADNVRDSTYIIERLCPYRSPHRGERRGR